MDTASARLEFRVRPERKSRIQHAADLSHVPLSEFARSAVEERAEQVLRAHEATTTVPAAFFDELLAAFDAPARGNAALAAAGVRARSLITRD